MSKYNVYFKITSSKLYPMIFVFLILNFLNISCDKPDEKIVEEKISLLFVGNSLTYTNDLPTLVKEIAKSKNKEIEVDMLALPNYALVDHLANGNLQSSINSEKYSFIIVQQGPSSQAEGRALLLEASTIIKKLCDEHNTKLAFYMVWPAYENYYNFDGVIKNYTDAANINNSLLCPVGKVWKDYIDSTGDLSYYGPDNFHPSVKGSEVAAEVIYKSLFE